MSTKKIGYALIVIGVLGVIGSIIIDYSGLGKPGIQAAQLLGIQVGTILATVGLGYVYSQQETKIQLKSSIWTIYQWILNLPTIVWVVIGFLIAYIMLFIFPMFLNPEHRLQYFYRYIPDKYPIGLDLNTIVASIKTWLSTNQGPYQNPDIFYPPLHHILVAPILLLDYPQDYYLIVTITLISMFILSFLIPTLVQSKKDFAVPAFFFITALFSYGFQFELERGQFNVITFTLCILSIYLFYFHGTFRYLAYLLFSFSVHLRIYPAIFIVMFIDDWTAWKQNIKRLIGIIILNIALLFVLGYPAMIDFFRAVSGKLGTSWTWVGNHSITSFVYNLTNTGFGLFDQNTLSWLKEHSTTITIILLFSFAACFIAVVLKDFVNKARGLNPDLLLICTLGGLMIPSVSHDYKLALLAGPMAIALSNRMASPSNWRKLFSAILITIASLAFSVTLFPFKYKPEYMANNFPSLFVILIAMTLLSFVAKPKHLRTDINNKSLGKLL